MPHSCAIIAREWGIFFLISFYYGAAVIVTLVAPDDFTKFVSPL